MEKIQVIINEWDPVGLFPMAPDDEYTNEIIKIFKYLNLNQNVTEEKLAKKINEIFLTSFGSDVYVEDFKKCLNIAKHIINDIRG